MNPVAKTILDQLAALQEQLNRIEQKVDAQDISFLTEPVAPEVPQAPSTTATVQTRKPAKRGPHKKHLPPKVARQIKDDTELSENTRNTYANTLNRLLDNAEIVPTLIAQRNKGKPYANIAKNSQRLFGRTFSEKVLSNMLSVGLRYQVIERDSNGRYVEGEVIRARS